MLHVTSLLWFSFTLAALLFRKTEEETAKAHKENELCMKETFKANDESEKNLLKANEDAHKRRLKADEEAHKRSQTQIAATLDRALTTYETIIKESKSTTDSSSSHVTTTDPSSRVTTTTSTEATTTSIDESRNDQDGDGDNSRDEIEETAATSIDESPFNQDGTEVTTPPTNQDNSNDDDDNDDDDYDHPGSEDFYDDDAITEEDKENRLVPTGARVAALLSCDLLGQQKGLLKKAPQSKKPTILGEFIAKVEFVQYEEASTNGR